MLYRLVLQAHSWLRWLTLLLAVVVLVRSLWAWRARRPYRPGDDRLPLMLVVAVDSQFLVGALLYAFLSPLTAAAFAAIGPAMKDGTLRFFALEHPVMMVVAVALLHVGRVRARRAGAGPERHRAVAVWTAVFLAVVAASIPWPGGRHGRPLFPEPAAVADEGAPVAPPDYAARCAACHGPAGHGDGPAAVLLDPPPRDFRSAAWHIGVTDAQIAASISNGGSARGLNPAMPASPDLPPATVEALVRYVRALRR